jgi:hypothetical protein
MAQHAIKVSSAVTPVWASVPAPPPGARCPRGDENAGAVINHDGVVVVAEAFAVLHAVGSSVLFSPLLTVAVGEPVAVLCKPAAVQCGRLRHHD